MTATTSSPSIKDFIAQLPKLELHAHIGGSARLSTLRELVERRFSAADAHALLDKVTVDESDTRTMDQVFALFDIVHKITDNLDAIGRIVDECLQDFAAQGVRYVELRSTPRATKDGDERKYVEVVLERIRKYQESAEPSRRFVDVGLLLSVNRAQSLEKAWQTIQLAAEFKDKGVCGLDFSGNFLVGPFSQFVDLFSRARSELGLRVTLHFGECHNDEDTKAILAYKPDRVGHASVLHNGYREQLVEAGTPVEVCFTSNMLCKHHATVSDHPFAKYKRGGRNALILCTDDMGVFGTTLCKEYELLVNRDVAQALLGISSGLDEDAWEFELKQQLYNVAASGIDHCFTSEESKALLKKEFKQFAEKHGIKSI